MGNNGIFRIMGNAYTLHGTLIAVTLRPEKKISFAGQFRAEPGV